MGVLLYLLFASVLDVDILCSLSRCRVRLALGLLHARRKLAAKSHFVNTTNMNQESELDVEDARQTLKHTKAKMREILTQIEANQEVHGEPQDAQVSVLWIRSTYWVS
jgi:hypothetical protein